MLPIPEELAFLQTRVARPHWQARPISLAFAPERIPGSAAQPTT
ncbi:hypothetical protein PQR75_34930 [Paraburkholderia fungorum]